MRRRSVMERAGQEGDEDVGRDLDELHVERPEGRGIAVGQVGAGADQVPPLAAVHLAEDGAVEREEQVPSARG